MATTKVDVSRNEKLRSYVTTLVDGFGVSARFLSREAGFEYSRFVAWKNGRKQFVDGNLDKIDEMLKGWHYRFIAVGEKISS